LAERSRTIRARFDHVEDSWRQIQRPKWSRMLPAPTPAAVATAIMIVEVRAGLRPPHQLERLSHYSLWAAWSQLAPPGRNDVTPIRSHPLAVTVRELAPGLVDATVVIDFGGRTHALALRLDGAQGFWQLIELDYTTDPAAVEPPAPGAPAPMVPYQRRNVSHSRDRHRRLLDEAGAESPRSDPLLPAQGLLECPGIELE
jgi:Family of unknown function (DUF6459)